MASAVQFTVTRTQQQQPYLHSLTPALAPLSRWSHCHLFKVCACCCALHPRSCLSLYQSHVAMMVWVAATLDDTWGGGGGGGGNEAGGGLEG
jgi:hypothetical protein